MPLRIGSPVSAGLVRRRGSTSGRDAQPHDAADSAELRSRHATGLADCGNWAVLVDLAGARDAVSGIYYARLHRRRQR